MRKLKKIFKDEKIYKEVATLINVDFSTVLHATANVLGISIAPLITLDLYRAVAMLEHSPGDRRHSTNAIKNEKLSILLNADCGIISIR